MLTPGQGAAWVGGTGAAFCQDLIALLTAATQSQQSIIEAHSLMAATSGSEDTAIPK